METDPFVAAMSLWTGGTADHDGYVSNLQKHWLKSPCTVLDVARQQKGRLHGKSEFEQLGMVQDARRQLSERDTLPEPVAAEVSATGLLPFQRIVNGLLAGLEAGHLLNGFHKETSELPDEAVMALTDCFRNYHIAWDLYTEPVNKIQGHASSEAAPTKAAAILDLFAAQANPKDHEWWTQSNWLLVHRLLSFILGEGEDEPEDAESASPQFPTNRMQMLLVTTNAGEWRGLTAPVTTSIRTEGFGCCYLDPVALGLTVLDDDMLNSLRIAARIARPKLFGTEQSLRISPASTSAGILALEGDSAGGLVTVATLATIDGRRLNRNLSASFTVRIPSTEDLRADPTKDLRREDVIFGPVSPESSEAKLTADAFQSSDDEPAQLNTVYLHADQKFGNESVETFSKRNPSLDIRQVANPGETP